MTRATLAIFTVMIAILTSACGGKPDSIDAEPASEETEESLGLQSISSISQIENKIWVNEAADDALIFMDSNGVLWQINVEDDADNGECLRYSNYLGEFTTLNDGLFNWVREPERTPIQVGLSIFDGQLNVRSSSGVQLSYRETARVFEDLPSLCAFETLADEGAVPVNNLLELDDVWETTGERSFGDDQTYWRLSEGVFYFIDYYGDSYARGERCFRKQLFNAKFFPVEENRYLEVLGGGAVNNIRIYDLNGSLQFARAQGTTQVDPSELIAGDLSPTCYSLQMPPPGSSEIQSLARAEGLWRLSFTFDDDRVDSMFALISADGQISLIDVQNDTFNAGESCSVNYSDFATIEQDRSGFSWQRNAELALFEEILGDDVKLYRQGEDLLVVGENAHRRFKNTEFSVIDLPPNCTSAGNIGIQDLSDVEGRLWRNPEDTQGRSFIYFEPQGYAWQLEENPDASCFDYQAYLGQFVPQSDAQYQRFYIDFDDGLYELGFSQGDLVIDAVGGELAERYTPTSIEFEQRPTICELGAETPGGNAQALTSVEQFNGNWRAEFLSGFGDDLIYWRTENGRERTYDFVGDGHAKAEACIFGEVRLSAMYFPLGGNRFLYANENGTVFDHDMYIIDGNLYFYERDIDYFIEAADLDPTDPNLACAGIDSPPLGAQEIGELSELQGFWDISFTGQDGSVNEIYFEISNDGKINAFDPQSDAVDNGAACSVIYEDFAELGVGEAGAFTWQKRTELFDNILNETVRIFADTDKRYIVGDFARRVLRRSALTAADLPRNCDLELSDLAVIAGEVWDNTVRLLLGEDELVDERYFVVNADGSVDSYDFQNDTFGTGEDCFIVELQSEQFLKDTSSANNNQYDYVREAETNKVQLSLNDGDFLISYLSAPIQIERYLPAGFQVTELAPICVP